MRGCIILLMYYNGLGRAGHRMDCEVAGVAARRVVAARKAGDTGNHTHRAHHGQT